MRLTGATEIDQREVGGDDERRDGDGGSETFHLEVLANRDAHGAFLTRNLERS